MTTTATAYLLIVCYFFRKIGASLAVNNWIVLLAIVILGMLSRIYRIKIEEQMLEAIFKEQYQIYMKRTWRLIPFIY